MEYSHLALQIMLTPPPTTPPHHISSGRCTVFVVILLELWTCYAQSQLLWLYPWASCMTTGHDTTLIARFMGQDGADWTQVGLMLARWTLLSGKGFVILCRKLVKNGIEPNNARKWNNNTPWTTNKKVLILLQVITYHTAKYTPYM